MSLLRRPVRSGRPKVLHVATTDMSLAWLLAPQLVAFGDAGYEVVGASAAGPYVADLAELGVRHVALEHATRSFALREDLQAFVELVRLFRRERPDVVHTHNPKPGVYGRIAARLARVPVVVNTVHGLYAQPDDPLARRAVVYGLERLAAAFSDLELVQSVEDVATLRSLRVPAAKLEVLGNGIDLARFTPTPEREQAAAVLRREVGGEGRIVVGAVGRLVWEKGLREIMAAAELLRTRCPEVLVVVVGGPDDDKADGLRAEELPEITERTGICFAGERHDMDVVYGAFDLFVLASHREGFPRAAMEAAAMGLPVVATDIRGCRQVVDDGVTGTLFPRRDAEALAAAVQELAADPDRRRRYGVAAQARAAEHFDQQTVIDRTLAAYHRLLARRR